MRMLGVIDADLSLAAVDKQMAQQRNKLLYFLLGAIVFGSALGRSSSSGSWSTGR